MGSITGSGLNTFKSAEYLYSKIKREFRSFDSVNLLDDADFPQYTADVLNLLGNIAYKEAVSIVHIENGRGKLPEDFKRLYAAYSANRNISTEIPNKLIQNIQVFENDITEEIIQRVDDTPCLHCQHDKVLERVTVKQYVNENVISYDYDNLTLLTPSPNAQRYCIDNKLRIHQSSSKEFTINNGSIFTNFKCNDIILQYYAFPVGDDGLPEIPDIIEVERAIEWYIKWKILLNFWLVDDLANALSKWQKAEQLYNEYFAEAKYIGKLPAFSTLVNYLRNLRGINKLASFSQHNRYNY